MYTPPQPILVNYAQIMLKYALNFGKGVKKGETIWLVGNEVSKPLFLTIRREAIKLGCHVIANYMPDDWDRYQIDRDLIEYGSGAQLDWFPQQYMKGLLKEIDHFLYISAPTNLSALDGLDPKKMMRKQKAYGPYMQWRNAKENKGDLSWTICMYGTEALATAAGMSLEDYWQEMMEICFLREKDPVKKWKDLGREMQRIANKLNALTPKIDHLHLTGPDIDLKVTPGEDREWVCARGANVPSFEIYTSPDWRGTEGWIRFNVPLNRHGQQTTGAELTFKKGKVVNATAKTGEKFLKALVATPGADKVGEFSLTDRRHSRITRYMATTLFDENMGGPHGNTHIAMGNCYDNTYAKGADKLTPKLKEKLGFNQSPEHTDLFSTTERTVTAHLKDGTERVIYQDGIFSV